MVDSLLNNIMKPITITSSLKKYKVNFIKINSESLRNICETNDIILIDKYVKKNFFENVNYKNIKFISINANEREKEYSEISRVVKKILKIGIKKNNNLIAIGGGITQDISSFVASILFRGIKWKFIPTTLLAQGDSCIGGKTSINFLGYKNQLGNFYPPDQIYIDTKFILGLKDSDLYSGVGEMAHYFFVDSKKMYNFFLNKYEKALKRDTDAINVLVYNALQIKKKFIEKDEFDQNERLILNYGHTYGHAIETSSNYKIPHGISVSYGMDISNFVSYRLGFIDKTLFYQMRNCLKKIYKRKLPKKIKTESLVDALRKDKKNIDSNLRFIATKGLGKMFIHKIPFNKKFIQIIDDYLMMDI